MLVDESVDLLFGFIVLGGESDKVVVPIRHNVSPLFVVSMF
jgi:hypothetical protein